MTPLAPAEQPTMYFVGVSTGGSSIRRVFPRWAEELGIDDATLVGVDLPLDAPRDDYRRFGSFLAEDPLSLGALVTTHKIDLFEACRDLFAGLDPYALALAEASCLSKEPHGLVGFAKDPLSAGLALDAFLPDGHWASSGGEAFLIGAGGAATAISSCLSSKPGGAPGRIVISDSDPQRLDKIRRFHDATATGVEIELVDVRRSRDNDEVLEALPPGSLVVNATGMGKDRPGSPISDAALFPEKGFAWELNYRGELAFLRQARAQETARSLHVEDGWLYFLHGWLQAIAEVFHLDVPTAGPAFDRFAHLAAGVRA
jgi:shikimate 5-dehydrogenase